MRFCKWLVMAFIICSMPVLVNAELERTVWAWDSRTPDRGNVLAGFWYTYGSYDYQGIDAHGETVDAEILLSYGINSHWSVGIIAAWNHWEETVWGTNFSEEGPGDTRAVTTYRILDEPQSGFDFALRVGLGIPTGNEDKYIGTGNWEPALDLLAAKTFGPVLAVANLGVKHIVDAVAAEENVIFSGDLECVLHVADRLSASFILSGWTSRWKSSADDTYLQIGTGLKVMPADKIFVSGTIFRLVGSDAINEAWYFSLGMGIEF